MAIAGPAQPVLASAESPVGGPAIPVVAYAPGALPAGRPITAGPAQPVYIVSAAEIAAGTFEIAGNTQPLVMAAVTGRTVTGQRPIPIYIVSGSLT